MRLPRPLVASLVLTAAACPLLAGCGALPAPATEEGGQARAPDAAAVAVAGDPSTWPLTGLPAKGVAARSRPVLVLKMDNTAASAPQVGLSAADLVVEELVEGGSTRLAVMYDSAIPDDAGPVRSMRASDIGIVSPIGADVVTSGAASPTVARIAKAGIDYLKEGDPGFYRASDRSAPYNLFADLTEVADQVTAKRTPSPAAYLPFGDVDSMSKGDPALNLAAQFSGGHTTTWAYDGFGYRQPDGFAAPDDEFVADNVLVLRVEVGDAGYRDPAGNPVPETSFVGSGDAMLAHGGRMVEGTWHKNALDAPLTLERSGRPLEVPAGRTWIELVPADDGAVSVTR